MDISLTPLPGLMYRTHQLHTAHNAFSNSHDEQHIFRLLGISGFVVAGISLFAFIVKTFRSHLPSNKIKQLDSLLDETEVFFKKTIEEGLLTEPDFVREIERHLTM